MEEDSKVVRGFAGVLARDSRLAEGTRSADTTAFASLKPGSDLALQRVLFAHRLALSLALHSAQRILIAMFVT